MNSSDGLNQQCVASWCHFPFPPLPQPLSLVLAHFFFKLFSLYVFILLQGFPGSSDSKVSAYNAGDLGSIPGSGRSPGEGNANPFQYSCLENPTD